MVKAPEKKERKSLPSEARDRERRKYVRVEQALKGRFLTEDGREQPCVLKNVSVGGALIIADHPPAFGKKVVLYIDDLGRFDAQVIRSEKGCFAVAYSIKPAKKLRTADYLTEILNRGAAGRDRRVHPRIKHDALATVYFEDGHSAKCAILDISLTGASIEIKPRPPLGTSLILGRMTAKVVRRHEKGVGVIFTGGAGKIDEIIKDASTSGESSETGAPIARKFGKKDARG
jgi:hypothetical protein